jgi:tRNA (cmo5U34)-methyltransferase
MDAHQDNDPIYGELHRYRETLRKWDDFGFYSACAGAVAANPPPHHVLDLGVGEGFELDAIFELLPAVQITGVDRSAPMLQALLRNNQGRKKPILIENISVFDFFYAKNVYDAAISVATMHHFGNAQRLYLYRKLRACLPPGARYVEGDKFISLRVEVARRLAKVNEMHLDPDVGDASTPQRHFDRPTSLETATRLMKCAGFSNVQIVRFKQAPMMAVVTAQ